MIISTGGQQWRFRHTLSRLYQPKELIPFTSLGSAKRLEEITSRSSRLLTEYGIIKSTAPGYFALLPLAVRSMNKLIKIIDVELERINCQKIQLPHVAPGNIWSKSGRLKNMGPELVRFKDRHNKEMVLSPTHEETITHMVSLNNLSVNQLPQRLYQVGSKFRAEMKPRFGLIRANEFVMKDLYTFDRDVASAQLTYSEVSDAYARIFDRIGVPYHRVEGSTGAIGGSLSHEFHFPAGIGQDELVICTACSEGKNLELDEGGDNETCGSCGGKLKRSKGIEVGHTFLLGQKYSKVFKAQFTGGTGKGETLEMGCYGIGVTRVMAAAVEALSTESEIRWPSLLAPYSVCVITPKAGSREYSGINLLDDLLSNLEAVFPGDVITDDREKLTIGKKQHEANRTGYPIIIILGKRSADDDPRIEVHIPADNIKQELRPSEAIQLVRNLRSRLVVH